MSARLLGAVLAATCLSACEDWDQLTCGLRHVCGGDAGAFQLQAGLDEDTAATLVGFAVGDSSQVLLTSRSVLVLDAAGVKAVDAAPSTTWAALDGLGAPSQLFLVDGAGSVRSWLEPRRPDQPLFVRPPGLSFTPTGAVGYLDDRGFAAVAVFGASAGSTWAAGFLGDGGALPVDSQACELADLQGAVIQGRGTALVVGIARGCEALAPGQGSYGRYVATLWPRASANPAPVLLSSEANPTRVRVGSNGEVATLAYEAAGGVYLARVLDGGVEAATRSVFLGGAVQSVLDDVQQLGDPDAFVYVLTNRNPASLTVTPDEVGAVGVVVPAGASLAVFGRWLGPGASQVTGTQLLAAGREFSRVLLASDPHQAAVWLAAACPRAVDGGVHDTYCPGPEAHLALLRWVP